MAIIETSSPHLIDANNFYLATTDAITTNIDARNSTNATSAFGRNEDLAKIEIAVQGLILFLAVFGNGIVLIILLTRNKKLSRMNLMIIHLSCADLFVAFFNVLPQMAWDITFRFIGGDFMCRSVKYLQVAAMYASSYVLIMTAVDRYLAICHPLVVHTWTRSRLHLLVLLAWMLSLSFSVPQIFIFSYQEITPGSGVYDCWGQFNPPWTLKLYITWFTVAIYIIPFLILTIAYGRICYVVWRTMRGREVSAAGPQEGTKSYKSTSSDISPHSQLSSTKTNRFRAPITTSCTKANRSRGSNSIPNAVSLSPLSEASPTKYSMLSVVNGSAPRAHTKGVSKSKVKTVKLTLTVIACYLVCWGPFFVTLMWSAWDENAPFTGSAMTIIILLASLNSCCNPWIYLIFTDNLCVNLSTFIKAPSPKPLKATTQLQLSTTVSQHNI